MAASRKDKARADVSAFLRSAERTISVIVRINPLASGQLELDLGALTNSRPTGVMLPKAEGARSVLELVHGMRAGRMTVVPILPIVTETPSAIFRMSEYADVTDHLMGLTWGAEDLSAAVSATTARTVDGRLTSPYVLARSLTLFAAHAAQVPAIETVYPGFRDEAGLKLYADEGAQDGFSGMLAIHPAQVSIINAAFTPSLEAIASARRIVEEFEKYSAAGVLSLDGKMIDAPHLKQARRILARTNETGTDE